METESAELGWTTCTGGTSQKARGASEVTEASEVRGASEVAGTDGVRRREKDRAAAIKLSTDRFVRRPEALVSAVRLRVHIEVHSTRPARNVKWVKGCSHRVLGSQKGPQRRFTHGRSTHELDSVYAVKLEREEGTGVHDVPPKVGLGLSVAS